MPDNRFAIEVEDDGVRKLYGPVDSLTEAKATANWIRSGRSAVKIRVHYLYSAAIGPEELHVHPNQTTVDEQIKDAEDYIDPATVD